MNLNSIQNIYLIGIGGIGMSALARYFAATGKVVAGYDKTKSEITEALETLNINIHYKDSVASIPLVFLNPETSLIIYTPAIPSSHKELVYFKNSGYTLFKRSEVLAELTKNTYCMAVAGTHGKTTTTCILGHLLKQSGKEVIAFLGGISENYNSNLIINGNKVSVVEADEYDRSFLTLFPDMACITAMDADHLDIYGTAKTIKDTFIKFSKQLKPKGKLFIKKGLPLKGITYGIEDHSDYTIQNIKIENGSYLFDIHTPQTTHKAVKFNIPGQHNLLNALVAFAMAIEYGCEASALVKALDTFKGVQRRFNCHVKSPKVTYIDDYAHHPEEIKAVYHTVKEMYPNQRTLVIFQPHLYSRTRDFGVDFACELSKFDEVLLLDIYPAREIPIKGINSQWLLDKIRVEPKKLITKSNLKTEILNTNAQIVLTLGAGDIGQEVEALKEFIKKELI